MPVWKDVLTTQNANVGKIAHIIAASADGPRGDPVLSLRHAKDPMNLMLLCGTHHDLVDKKEMVDTYPVARLQDHKQRHEEHVERLCEIDGSRKSVALTVSIPVGSFVLTSPAVELDAAMAQMDLYPDPSRMMPINLNGMLGRDHDDAFWTDARKAVGDQVHQNFLAAAHRGPLHHVSVFAFGPIPLMIQLGAVLDEKSTCAVFNRHRAPKGWEWPCDGRRISAFRVHQPSGSVGGEVALVISLTSRVSTEQVRKVLAADVPIFEVDVDDPLLDGLRSPAELGEFASASRDVMERIHRSGASRVHLFAAVPVAAAVEFGRTLQKKLHPPIQVYDYHSGAGGWRRAFTLTAEPPA